MNQTVTLPKGFGVLKRDLCTICIHAEWFWMPITKQYGYESYVIRYELAKLCYAKPLKQMFNKGLEAQRKHIQQIMFECKRFSNSGLLTGFISNPNNFKETMKNMPKLGIPILKTLPDIESGHRYLLKSAEVTTTSKEKYDAVRVGLLEVDETNKPLPNLETNKKGESHSCMLWLGEKGEGVSGQSKLGSFMRGFGTEDKPNDNTDEWLDKVITVESWKKGNREIEVVD